MITKEEVLEALKSVYDPEIPLNVVDLGLIYDVLIEDARVKVKMTLTAPGCPMALPIGEQVRKRLLSIPEVEEAEVEMVWDPPWVPSRINQEALQKLFSERACPGPEDKS